jgi:hypothetical protein
MAWTVRTPEMIVISTTCIGSAPTFSETAA